MALTDSISGTFRQGKIDSDFGANFYQSIVQDQLSRALTCSRTRLFVSIMQGDHQNAQPLSDQSFNKIISDNGLDTGPWGTP